jgi:hypothetical protein
MHPPPVIGKHGVVLNKTYMTATATMSRTNKRSRKWPVLRQGENTPGGFGIGKLAGIIISSQFF